MPGKVHSLEQILNKLRQLEIAGVNGKSIEQKMREIGVSECPGPGALLHWQFARPVELDLVQPFRPQPRHHLRMFCAGGRPHRLEQRHRI